MSVVSSIQSGAGPAGSRASAFSSLSSEQFLKLIFTELGRQDPLQPSDTKAMIEQLAGIRSIQADMDLASRLEALAAQNELSAASGLIGRVVSGVSEDNERVTERVASVSRTAGGTTLTLADGSRVRMSSVDEILASGGGS